MPDLTAPAIRSSLTQRYVADGYVAIDEFFDEIKVDEINDRINTYIDTKAASVPREHVFLEKPDDISSIKQLQKLHEHDDYFRTLMMEGPTRELAEVLLGGAVSCQNMQFFNKPAGIGQPTPPHQDGYYFHLEPCLAVTGWLALEPVDEETGCVHYVKGSHLAREFRPHGRTGTLGFSQGITDFGTKADREGDVGFPAAPGTLLMHDARTVHWASGNTSADRSRRALGFIYYAERASFNRDSWQAYQNRLKDELLAEGKI